MAWSLIVTYRLPGMRTECTPNTSHLVASGPSWFPILFAKEEGAATGIDVSCAIKGPDVADDEIFDITPRIFHASAYGDTVIPSECRLLVARKKEFVSFPARDGGPPPAPLPTFPEYTVRPCDGMVDGLVHVWHPVKAEFNGAKQRPLYRISLVATRRSNGESSEAPASPPFVWQVKASDSSRLIDEAGLPIMGERLKPLRQTGGNPRLEGLPRLPPDEMATAGTRRSRAIVEEDGEGLVAAAAPPTAALAEDADFAPPRASNSGPKRPRVVHADTSPIAAPIPRPKPAASAPRAAGSASAGRAVTEALSRVTLLYLGQLAARDGWYSDPSFTERVRGALQALPRNVADEVAQCLPGVPAAAPPPQQYRPPFPYATGAPFAMTPDTAALMMGYASGGLNPSMLAAFSARAAAAAASSMPMGYPSHYAPVASMPAAYPPMPDASGKAALGPQELNYLLDALRGAAPPSGSMASAPQMQMPSSAPPSM